MKRGLLQKDVAHILGINEMMITNWENNKRTIQTRHIPKVVEFLGFIPDVLKDFHPLKSEIFLYRCKYGITQREMAQQLGIDASTLHALEWGKRKMIERTKALIQKHLSLGNNIITHKL
jgi:DNA-binding XRE family transcriptional regulator